jgi:hypothetical protein
VRPGIYVKGVEGLTFSEQKVRIIPVRVGKEGGECASHQKARSLFPLKLEKRRDYSPTQRSNFR